MRPVYARVSHLALLLLPHAAHAGETTLDRAPLSPRTTGSGSESRSASFETSDNIVGLKLEGLESFHASSRRVESGEGEVPTALESAREEHNRLYLGAAAFYERILIEESLSLEFNLPVLFTKQGVTMPLDVLIKKNFLVSDHLEAFVGLGVLFVAMEEGHASAVPGVAGSMGVFLWTSERLGIDLETDYGVRFSPNIYEVTLAAGPAFRF